MSGHILRQGDPVYGLPGSSGGDGEVQGARGETQGSDPVLFLDGASSPPEKLAASVTSLLKWGFGGGVQLPNEMLNMHRLS